MTITSSQAAVLASQSAADRIRKKQEYGKQCDRYRKAREEYIRSLPDLTPGLISELASYVIDRIDREIEGACRDGRCCISTRNMRRFDLSAYNIARISAGHGFNDKYNVMLYKGAYVPEDLSVMDAAAVYYKKEGYKVKEHHRYSLMDGRLEWLDIRW